MHVLFIASLNTDDMTQAGVDQYNVKVAIKKPANHPSVFANIPVQTFNYIIGSNTQPPAFAEGIAIGKILFYIAIHLTLRPMLCC